jgi:hypothetical protein
LDQQVIELWKLRARYFATNFSWYREAAKNPEEAAKVLGIEEINSLKL